MVFQVRMEQAPYVIRLRRHALMYPCANPVPTYPTPRSSL